MTYTEYLTRRRSPQWIRDTGSDGLHAIARYLRHRSIIRDLTTGQEWLWGVVVNELEYRHRLAIRTKTTACWCDFCICPFEE